jgi:uncharacterized RDD family membrane protein YckC
MLAKGEISRSELAWHTGLTGWVPLSSVLAALMPPRPDKSVLAEPAARLGAVVLDCLIATVCIGAGFMVMEVDRNDVVQIIGWIMAGLGTLGLLITQVYLLTTRGQTLGKKIVGVRIVIFEDNSNPGFIHACLLRLIIPSLLNSIPILGLVFFIIDSCFIFRDDRRCVHDLIAGTKVVKA